MGRLPRFRLGPGIYHVINRGINDAWIMAMPEERDEFVRLLAWHQRNRRLRIYHWVVMSNHFHLAVAAQDVGELSAYVGKVCSMYSLAWHERKGGRGTLWQGRYRSILVQREGYLDRLGRYIERNPLMVEKPEIAAPEEYRWSSAAAYLLGAKDPLVRRERHPHWERWGEDDPARVARYRKLLGREDLDDAELFGQVDGVIGDEDFQRGVRAVRGRRADKKRGRRRGGGVRIECKLLGVK